FDNFLVSKLDRNYADVRLGATLTHLERQQDRWNVTLETSGETTTETTTETITLNPKLIIAADGANSTVLQKLGIAQPIERYYDSVQGYFRGVTGFEGPEMFHIEGHFLPESNPGFFFVVPLADGIFNVGVGKPRSDVQQQNVDLSALLPEVMQHHPRLSTRFTHAESASELRSWPVMVGPSERVSVSGAGYLVTGDAAGLCNPLTCYGTGNSMVSGMLAASQVKQSITQQRFDGETLKTYDRALYDRFQKEFQTSNLLKTFTKRNWLFNLVTASNPIQSALRQNLKGTSTMLKKL
ncbi:MAG: NAD(P)/FAD-dependent oxidoreductase, partial [Cyanobacteriota bacterium]|nr:NAD(P)/FAD-dependent oxidoreductase [Cyanobacteriota bacterium]